MNRIFLFQSLLILSACTTTREKILRDMAVASAVGVVLGQQQEFYKDANSLMYAGVLTSAAAVAGLYLYDPDNQIKSAKAETEELRKKLDQDLQPMLESQAPGTLNGKIPKNYRAMIQPGAWKVYALDQWVEDGENRIIHQDKVMELIPPTLIPVQNKILKKSESRRKK